MALLFLLDRIYGIILKFEHALFSGRRIKGNRQIGRVIILFDPEHFNDVYKPLEGMDPPLYMTWRVFDPAKRTRSDFSIRILPKAYAIKDPDIDLVLVGNLYLS